MPHALSPFGKKSPGRIAPLLLAFAIPVVVLLFAAVVIVVRGGGRFGGLDPFPYSAYLRDAETLRGNTYLLRGQIESRLGHDETKGSLIGVRMLDAAGAPVPVFVPLKFGGNLDVGQRFNLKVTVRRDMLSVEDMEKL